MNAQQLGGLVVGALALPLLMTPAAFAAECQMGADCGQCSACTADYGGGDFIEIGAAASDVTGSSESNDQRGYYPESWLSSGRVSLNGHGLTANRFELSWQDISNENGRAWSRLSLWPVTFEFDGTVIDSYAWNMYSDLALQHQEVTNQDMKLRVHDGELDNMRLRYESREYKRDEPAPLWTFKYQRLSYQYNFNLGGDNIKGSLRQIATGIDAQRTGTTAGETDSTVLKVDARLNDTTSLYGRGTYTMFNFDNLPDEEFHSTDFTVGLEFEPHPRWEVRTDYRARDYPDDNTIPSHVEAVDAYSARVRYMPGCGDLIEAGYRRSSIDYAQLHMQDPDTKAQLRSTAQLTPADVDGSVTRLTPEQDEAWVNVHWSLTDRLTTLSKVSFIDSQAPGTDLVGVGRPTLFYDERWKYSTNWTYEVSGRDLLSVAYTGSNAFSDDRDREFETRFAEGSWSRCTGGDGYLTLAVSNADATLDFFGILSDSHTTSDTTYLASFADAADSFDYGLNLSLTEGSGTHEYEQVGAGVDLVCKRLGPVSLSVDWFDRNYDTYPELDTEAVEVALSYRIDF